MGYSLRNGVIVPRINEYKSNKYMVVQGTTIPGL